MLIPARDKLTILFAHAAYQLGAEFGRRKMDVAYKEATTAADCARLAPEADVICLSSFWKDALLPTASRLKFIQTCSVGYNQFGLEAIAARGIRMANARGVNERAVAEHAMGLILAMTRQIASTRDYQLRKQWRGMIANPAIREEEIGGKTMLIVGLGTIGQRLAALAKAFDMKVVGVRRDPAQGKGPADAVYAQSRLLDLLPEADVVALTCPLTPETTGIINAAGLARMKPGAYLVNVARGPVVDEAALIAAMKAKRIAGAALDTVMQEPLPATSELWDLPNVLVTPHTGGETRAYEVRVIDVLVENLERLWRGEAALRNQII